MTFGNQKHGEGHIGDENQTHLYIIQHHEGFIQVILEIEKSGDVYSFCDVTAAFAIDSEYA